jgi:hypothetical protein
LLTSRQPLAQDGDDLAVGRRLLASTQLGSNSRLSRISARVISGYGPGP